MEDIKNKILQILKKETDCEAIIIFGSYARGTQNQESDIDIAIKSKNSITKKQLYDINNKLSDELKRDIDLINLDTIENDGLKYEILINGILIYCENNYEFDMYKLDAFREYLELNEIGKKIKRILEKYSFLV